MRNEATDEVRSPPNLPPGGARRAGHTAEPSGYGLQYDLQYLSRTPSQRRRSATLSGVCECVCVCFWPAASFRISEAASPAATDWVTESSSEGAKCGAIPRGSLTRTAAMKRAELAKSLRPGAGSPPATQQAHTSLMLERLGCKPRSTKCTQ